MDKSNFTRNENQIALFSDTNELLAEITFPYIDEQTVDVNHTFVDSSLRGQGIAGKLMEALIEELEARNLKAVPACSYAQNWFDKHPEYSSLISRS